MWNGFETVTHLKPIVSKIYLVFRKRLRIGSNPESFSTKSTLSGGLNRIHDEIPLPWDEIRLDGGWVDFISSRSDFIPAFPSTYAMIGKVVNRHPFEKNRGLPIRKPQHFYYIIKNASCKYIFPSCPKLLPLTQKIFYSFCQNVNWKTRKFML